MNLGQSGLCIALGAIFFLNCVEKEIAGSVTQTGNVTGKVIIKDSGKAAAGASVSFFKKEAAVLSPDESFAPVKTAIADDDGIFSTDLDQGVYTALASGSGKTAFVASVIAGSRKSDEMLIAMQNPGTITGKITNAVDLRENGAIIVRVLGTNIFQNVGAGGEFSLQNVPNGDLTLAIYSTSMQQFSPVYQTMNVSPDSIKTVPDFELDYSGIPIPKDITINYDTAKQTISISWQSLSKYKDFQEYAILRGIGGGVEHDLKQIAYTTDTQYVDRLTFASADTIRYEYAVRVNNKMGQYGQYYGIYNVNARPYQGKVDAGADTMVDIGDSVKLMGIFGKSGASIVKTEWKLGSADWIKSDSGEATFIAGSSLLPETTACIFRVIDSLGNRISDTLLVRKEMLITNHAVLPGELSDTNAYPEIVKFQDKFWHVSGWPSASFSSWSTPDFKSWKLEASSLPIANNGGFNGQFVSFNGKLFIINLDSNIVRNPQLASYSSGNGRDWQRMTVTPPPPLSMLSDSGRIYNYYQQNSRIIEFHSKLFALMEIDVSDTGSNPIQYTLMRLISSVDAANWTYACNLPRFDYRFGYILFSCNDRLYFASLPGGLRYTEVQSTQVYVSSDEGKTWQQEALWGMNGTDQINFVRSSDSVIFVSYYENGATERQVFLHNGQWIRIPQTTLDKERFQSNAFWDKARANYWRQIGIPSWVEGNKFFWIDPMDTVKSIKLF